VSSNRKYQIRKASLDAYLIEEQSYQIIPNREEKEQQQEDE